VADGGSRTAAEREAARLERERRRAKAAGPEPRAGAAPEPPVSPDPEPPVSPDPEPPVSPDPEPPVSPGPEPHDAGQDDPAVERASGTKRVSRAGTVSAPRGRSTGAGRGRDRGKPAPPPRRRGPSRSPRTRHGHSWLGRIVVLVIFVLAAAVVWFGIELYQPFGTSPHGDVRVIVPAKATTSEIGDLLARDGIVPSSFFFQVRATLSGERSNLRAGVYRFQQGMSYSDVLTKLTKAPPAAKVSELTVAEGRRRAQISALLRQQHIKGNYLAATRTTKLLDFRAYGLRHAPPDLEGFLFPDTYQLVDPIKIGDLVTDQLKEFKQQFGRLNLRYAKRKNLTPYDVLKIASLIEAETPTAHDRPLVASVIYNRLRVGMPLGLDSTTQYATGNFTRPLTESQLHSRSPYNTRTHTGLPPTPIDNPGLASLQAAAHPAQTHYLYFFATSCQRNSVFATGYRQFLAQGRKYAAKRC
jgi:uncharacterized YceG family protein